MSKITYEDKVDFQIWKDVPDKNKVKADDVNEIKRVVNENDDTLIKEKEKVDQLQAEIESYQNSLPRETLEGEYITMQNTADKVRFKDFVLGGNSKQESRSGKNKFNKDENATILSYVTEEKIENGIKLNVNNITPQWAVARYNIADVSNLIGKTVRLKAEFTNSNANGGYYIILANAETQKTVVDTTQNSGEVLSYVIKEEDVAEYPILRIGLRADNAQEGGYVDYKNIIVTIDDEDMSYEEYGAMPSPEFPAKIQNVEGDVEVTVANKNLANKDEIYMNMKSYSPENCAEEIVDGRDCIKFANTRFRPDVDNPFNLINYKYKENTAYTFRILAKAGELVSEGSGALTFQAVYTDGSKVSASKNKANATDFVELRFVTDPSKTIARVGFNYGTSCQWYMDKSSVFIAESDTTDYVPNEQQTIVFPLAQNQKLMLGDYLDDDGIHHVRKQIVLDGTESNWVLNGNFYDIATQITLRGLTGIKAIHLCTHFINGQVANGMWLGGSLNFLPALETGLTTLESWKAYLAQQKQAGTPVIVEYEPAEEEIEPYTEEQQEADNKLKELTTYAGQTNIYSTNNIKPVFTVTGIKDVNSLITQVNQLILEGGN